MALLMPIARAPNPSRVKIPGTAVPCAKHTLAVSVNITIDIFILPENKNFTPLWIFIPNDDLEKVHVVRNIVVMFVFAIPDLIMVARS